MSLQVATSGLPEIRMLEIEDERPQAELLTYGEARERFSFGIASQDPPEPTLVWAFVTEGQWQDAFPRPAGASTPTRQTYFFAILDAETGELYAAGTF